jgi:uncharacterized membrane protein
MPILTNDIQETRGIEETSALDKTSKRSSYWGGFAAGAAIGTGAAIAAAVIANLAGNRDRRIVRLEDSVQIGRHVEDVFRAWRDLERLADSMQYVNRIRVDRDLSTWDATVDGKAFRWKAQITQMIPNEAIGWKSVSGPKHTGRIVFSPVGDDTLIHVTMNYAPPVSIFGRLLSPFSEHLESYINQCLRDFKDAMENGISAQKKPPQAGWRDSMERMRETAGAERKPANKVDYTRPPEYKYPRGS